MGKPSDPAISAAASACGPSDHRSGHWLGRHHGGGWNATPRLLPELANLFIRDRFPADELGVHPAALRFYTVACCTPS